MEFLEKLSALVPPPRTHLTRFHGILAPHSKFRSLVVPAQLIEQEEIAEESTDGKSLEVEEENIADSANGKRISWAKLLSRVFAIDMNSCDLCGGEMKAISAVMKENVVVKILTYLGLQATAAPISPSKIPRQEEFWDQSPHFDEFSQVN